MNVNQVYSIVNNVAAQMYGDTAVRVTDMQGIISLGKDVLSSDTTKDKFLNILVDRIGKTIISQRAYSADVSALINDSFTFGAILQKIYVAPIKASESKQWDLTAGSSVDQYIISKPTVSQKLFSTRNTWSITITIPDFQLSSAFTNATEMATFIDAIFLAIRNSQEVYLAAMSEMCYANMIGEEIVYHSQGGATVIDLLAAYNTLMSKALTVSQALHDMDFLKYASMTINLYVKKMGKMSTVFNAEQYARFTPTDRMRVIMLADFTSACASYLQSNTYHDELVALPKYKEISYWQGIGNNVNFEQASKVAIQTASGHTLIQNGVVCMLCDEESIGLTYDNRRSKSAYNSNGEYTNFFEKADMGYFNDLSENCVVFTIGPVATPTTSSVPTTPYVYSKAAAANVDVTISLASGDTVSAISVDGTALTANTDYTIDAGALVIKSNYLYAKNTGSTVAFNIELASHAVMEFYITVTA